jgi:hypothetical protein
METIRLRIGFTDILSTKHEVIKEEDVGDEDDCRLLAIKFANRGCHEIQHFLNRSGINHYKLTANQKTP